MKFWPDAASKRRMKIYLKVATGCLVAFILLTWWGTRFDGDGTVGQARGDLPAIEERLRRTVTHLSETIGERNVRRHRELDLAADWIRDEWKALGLTVREHLYATPHREGCRNLEVDVAGPEQAPIILFGAHYDSVLGSPGADDNASGVAILMEITRAFAGTKMDRRLRCVAFTNEEPPYFATEAMGSRAYSHMARGRQDPIEAMVSLEALGWYSGKPGSQSYPPGFGFFYPSEGNFAGVVSKISNRWLVERTLQHLRPATGVPLRAASVYATIPGVYWSDHWSFWEEGYPAVMITDTAYFRNPHYHQHTDRADSLDYRSLADLTSGILDLVRGLTGAAR